jgi:hypothetical protein
MDESLSWRARARRQLYQNPNIGNGLIAMSIAMGIVALSLSYRQRLHHTIGNLTLLVSSQSRRRRTSVETSLRAPTRQ